MQKLRKKLFAVICVILGAFLITMLSIFNIQLYSQEKNAVQSNFEQAIGMRDDKRPDFDDIGDAEDNAEEKAEAAEKFIPPKRTLDDIMFIDKIVYTVRYDDSGSVEEVINHSDDGVSDEEIQSIAASLTEKYGDTSRVGNLYFDKYSYKINSGDMTIINNEAANKRLLTALEISIGIFVAGGLLIVFVSKKLTDWLIKPVEENFKKQKQFIADASHELKTPLAVIMASTDALENNPDETKWLENIKSESDRMNNLIADLLELAKSEEINDKLNFTTGSLSKAIEKSVLTFEGLAFEKGITMDYDIEENIEIEMDEVKIKQLAGILLDNAIKHSEKGSEISVSLKKDKDVTFVVKNEGEGIPKGEEDKTFERFYRADESRNRSENRYGLGLAIAKNIAENHNATISAKSENGFTAFTVIFKY